MGPGEPSPREPQHKQDDCGGGRGRAGRGGEVGFCGAKQSPAGRNRSQRSASVQRAQAAYRSPESSSRSAALAAQLPNRHSACGQHPALHHSRGVRMRADMTTITKASITMCTHSCAHGRGVGAGLDFCGGGGKHRFPRQPGPHPTPRSTHPTACPPPTHTHTRHT